MSLNGSVDENLIDSEYAYPAGRKMNSSDGWSEVSWHTQSIGGTSTASTLAQKAHYRSRTSNTGSSRTYASSLAERSSTTEVHRNTWAKIPAAPRGPPIVSALHTILTPLIGARLNS